MAPALVKEIVVFVTVPGTYVMLTRCVPIPQDVTAARAERGFMEMEYTALVNIREIILWEKHASRCSDLRSSWQCLKIKRKGRAKAVNMLSFHYVMQKEVSYLASLSETHSDMLQIV